MRELKNEYKSFLDDIEKNIKDEKDLEYIKMRFADFMDIVLKELDSISNNKEEKINQLEETQRQLDEKMQKIQQVIDNIEKDIYSEEGFDFEIVCPYCNYEFIIDMDENKKEIECPECENIIELDWSGDISDENEIEGCNGNCGSCQDCEQDEDDDM